LYQDLHRRKNRLHARLVVRPAAGIEFSDYLKRRLVPWGEYLPFETILPRMRTWFPEAGRLNAGVNGNEISVRFADMPAFRVDQARLKADLTLMSSPAKIRAAYPLPKNSGQVTVKPLLCYEALFPADSRVDEARLIVNLASDAWFGDGVEGEQHAGAVALRAVENGVPMLRAAMSGVSFMVDARGEDLAQRSGQGRPAILHADIPLESRKTVFGRFGMAAFYALMAAFLWPYALERWFSRRRQRA
jgi:apolipoprotein N-acyltransferase